MSSQKRKHPGKQAAKAVASPPVLPARPPDPAALACAPELLGAVAGALNECERAGIPVQLAHGAVITDAGYVFAVLGKHGVNFPGESWVVRTRMLTEFPAPPGGRG